MLGGRNCTARGLCITTFLMVALQVMRHAVATSSAESAASTKVSVGGPWRSPSGGLRRNIPIGYTNAPNRNGQLYLPSGIRSKQTVKVLVLLHGSGMNGGQMVDNFWQLADRYRFMIIAPDSHNPMYWFAPNGGQQFTSDFWHVQACYHWAETHTNLNFDRTKIAYAGFSRGGYSAAALASRFEMATHALVIHSSITPSQFGDHKVPIWISTGTTDPMFGKARSQQRIADFQQQKPGWAITFRMFQGGHTLSNPGEISSAIQWWMSTDGANC